MLAASDAPGGAGVPGVPKGESSGGAGVLSESGTSWGGFVALWASPEARDVPAAPDGPGESVDGAGVGAGDLGERAGPEVAGEAVEVVWVKVRTLRPMWIRSPVVRRVGVVRRRPLRPVPLRDSSWRVQVEPSRVRRAWMREIWSSAWRRTSAFEARPMVNVSASVGNCQRCSPSDSTNSVSTHTPAGVVLIAFRPAVAEASHPPPASNPSARFCHPHPDQTTSRSPPTATQTPPETLRNPSLTRLTPLVASSRVVCGWTGRVGWVRSALERERVGVYGVSEVYYLSSCPLSAASAVPVHLPRPPSTPPDRS
ncbi:hypothetical protein GCM10009804_36220 [Kribbella hippodromi]|uniref:Uncharacterized protein n=1 Tax=Kribbella hippodromi TaxID=434347 RepID=A0ABN2DEY3_9ACTN